jgi:hypothetical protein
MTDDFERGAIYDWLKNERRLALAPYHRTIDSKLLSALWQETQQLIDELDEFKSGARDQDTSK